jgi:5'-3' exonuclease
MRILAVDLSSVCRPFWELYQSARLSDGEAFTKSLERIKRAADGFDRVAVAIDVGTSFRKLHCPTYKSTRKDAGEAYRRMVEDVTRRIVADGALVFPNRGEKAKIGVDAAYLTGHDLGALVTYYPEADDILASLVAWYHRQIDDGSDGWHLRILSGDTDTWALVDDVAHIDVEPVQNWRPKDGSDRRTVDERDVCERFGGIGSWVTEVKALAGDDGDEYHPFPHHDPTKKGGIGEKKAASLLRDYGISGIADGADYDAGMVLHRALLPDGDPQQMSDCHERKCLRAGGHKALDMGYACARMKCDLPIEFSRILVEPKVEPIAATAEIAVQSVPQNARALAKYSPASSDLLDPNALQPQSIADLFEVGKMVVNSRVYPHIDCPEKAMVVIAEARERRVPYATALRNAYFVRGKLAWSAAFISGLVLRSSVCDVFEIAESTFTYAIVDYQRKGRPLRQFKFELQEAVNAGWTKKSLEAKGEPKWITNPRVMLRWAALRESARAFFPDVVSGMYTPDELRDGHVLDAEFEQTESEFER